MLTFQPFGFQFIAFLDPGSLQFYVLLCQFVLGGLMLVAGLQKVFSRNEFERTLRYTFGIPRRFSASLALCLPVVESLLGLMLIYLVQSRIASSLTALLLVLFSCKLIQLRLVGIQSLECNCFGTDQEERPISILIFRNMLLIVLAAIVFLEPPNPASWSVEHPFIYVVLTATTAISFLLLVSIFSRVLILFRGAAHATKNPTKVS
jgi:hypothetical protein